MKFKDDWAVARSLKIRWAKLDCILHHLHLVWNHGIGRWICNAYERRLLQSSP